MTDENYFLISRERDITESRFRYIIINDLSEDDHFDWYNLLINFNDDA